MPLRVYAVEAGKRPTSCCLPMSLSAAWMMLEPPLQLVALPVTAEVGRAFTVTVALPVRSPA